jgi:hypothetical protein
MFWQIATFGAVSFLLPLGAAAQSAAALLVQNILDEIVMPAVWFLVAVAVAIFVYGIFTAITKDSQEMKNRGRRIATWGLGGLLVMVSALGIMRMITEFIGAEDTVQIDETGSINITVPDIPGS